MSETDAPTRPQPYRLLREVDRLARARGDAVARGHGTTLQQWELLARLRRAGGSLDQRELCCRFRVAPATLTALVDAAEERGWVERRPMPGDRRRRVVGLTDAGCALVEGMPHLGRRVAARMLAGFTAAERDQLAALLDRAARNLREEDA